MLAEVFSRFFGGWFVAGFPALATLVYDTLKLPEKSVRIP
jgi:hypothetical protein